MGLAAATGLFFSDVDFFAFHSHGISPAGDGVQRARIDCSTILLPGEPVRHTLPVSLEHHRGLVGVGSVDTHSSQ